MNEKKCGEMLIYPVPDPSELDMGEIENIVRHTHNTWQHDRPLWEIRKHRTGKERGTGDRALYGRKQQPAVPIL